jgi:hypothetical protein
MTSIFAPLSASMLADPHAVYARLRAEDPVHWHDQLSAWVVTRHDDCARILKDTGTFGSDPRALGKPIPPSVLSLQTLDPPEHTAVRRRFLEVVRRQEGDTWATMAQRAADEVVAGLHGVVDFVRDVAEPLALQAVCTLYGIAFPADHERFRTTSRTMILGMDAGLDPARREPALAARDVLNTMIAGWRAQAREGGVLATVDAGDDRVLRNSLRAVFDAGYSTTSNLLSNSVLWLTSHGAWTGDELSRLDERATDELVRLAGPVQVVSRHCKSDVDLRGRRIRRGDVVIVVLAAANRDPEVFESPDTADFTRSPNPHLGLGRGTHSCFGGHLGRQLLLALLRALRHTARIEAAGPPTRRPTATQRGVDHLPIRVVTRGTG